MERRKVTRGSTQCSQAQLQELIRSKAQEIYVKKGRPEGRDLENWLEAERIVTSRSRR